MLTKSKYKLASECPRKLYYQSLPDRYANTKRDDEFLQALADGGHQVGALAQALHPSGVLVSTLNADEAVRQTAELLQRPEVIIFEAALRVGPYLVRVDILDKRAGRIRLLEVKAKSWDPTSDRLVGARGGVLAEWIEYVEDIAFQTWVARQVIPDVPIDPSLLFINKTAVVNGDGLHQLFRIERNGNQVEIQITNAALAVSLGATVLTAVDAGAIVDKIIAGTAGIAAESSSESGPMLPDRAALFARYLASGQPMPVVPPIGVGCKSCEFRADATAIASGQQSGFYQCWTERLGDRHRPDRLPLFSLWLLQAKNGKQLMEQGVYYLDEVTDGQIRNLKPRQQRQLASVRGNGAGEVVGAEIGAAMSSWRFPLHFLDFETMTPALPFHGGMSPYQLLAFQFSCHHLHADGRITHDQFLEMEPGAFPSWRFLQELHRILGHDGGTILRYGAHENSVLRTLRRQLIECSTTANSLRPSADLDVDGLTGWIDQITTTNERDGGERESGARNMVDLLQLVKDSYFHPMMEGSNSIKQVLPAVMTASTWLRQRYQQPLTFGTNLQGKVLWQLGPDGQAPRDPYDLLPPVFDGFPRELLNAVDDEQGVQNGGAAMMAYASMQYTEVSAEQRAALSSALLRYCELDTIAMLMIVQHWKSALGIPQP